jgi:hypothetical protein
VRRCRRGVPEKKKEEGSRDRVHERAAGDDEAIVRAAIHVHGGDQERSTAGDEARSEVAETFMNYVARDVGEDSDGCDGQRIGFD